MKPNTDIVISELFKHVTTVVAALDVDALLKPISTIAEQYLSAEAVTIFMLDEDKQTMTAKVSTGDRVQPTQKVKGRLGHGIAGTVAQTLQSLIVGDPAAHDRFVPDVDQPSGITARALMCVPIEAEGEILGVIEAVNKKDGAGFTDADLSILSGVASLAAAGVSSARKANALRNFFANTLELLVSAVEARDPRLAGHSWKVAETARRIARVLGVQGQAYKDVYYGALLHDIGILGVRDSVCMVDGLLVGKDQNPEITHPRIGSELVKNIALLKGAAPIIRHHHECYDGTGFPDALTGEHIPEGARIVAVAEVAEELRAAGVPDDRLKQMLERGANTRFDPAIVAAYIKEQAP